MEITEHRLQVPDPISPYLHIGAWCEEDPPTSYSPLLHILCNGKEEDHDQEMKPETFQKAARNDSKPAHATASRRTYKTKNKTDTLFRAALDSGLKMQEATPKLPTPMTQRWLMETTPDEPWRVMEATQDAHIRYNVQIEQDRNHPNEEYCASNTGATFNGSLSLGYQSVQLLEM